MIRGRSRRNGSAIASWPKARPVPRRGSASTDPGRAQGAGTDPSELPPGELSFGSRKFSWLEIDCALQ